MASSYGEDASKSALRSGYDLLCARLTPRHEAMVQRDIIRNLASVEALRTAAVTLAYLPFRGEVDLSPYIERLWGEGRAVALPRLDDARGTVEFCLATSWADVERSRGRRQAHRGLAALGAGELEGAACLVPGLVFDAQGHRVDYGAGFLDNFLRGFAGVKVGVARSMQVSGSLLPADANDVAVDILVSDGAIWNCR